MKNRSAKVRNICDYKLKIALERFCHTVFIFLAGKGIVLKENDLA